MVRNCAPENLEIMRHKIPGSRVPRAPE